MQNKLLALVGFAQKAGKAVSGNELVLAELKKGKISVVFIGSDISPQSSKKIINFCDTMQIKYYTTFTIDELSNAIGKSGRTVVGIKRSELSQAIEKCIFEDNLSD